MDHAVDAADLYFQVSRKSHGRWKMTHRQGRQRQHRGRRRRSRHRRRKKPGSPIRTSPARGTGRGDSAPRAPSRSRHPARACRPGADSCSDPLTSLEDNAKVAWLERVDRGTRAMDPRIKQVMASCNAVHEVVPVADSGALAADARPLVCFNVSGHCRVMAAARWATPVRVAAIPWRSWGKAIADCTACEPRARRWLNLEAVPAPAGSMPVVPAPRACCPPAPAPPRGSPAPGARLRGPAAWDDRLQPVRRGNSDHLRRRSPFRVGHSARRSPRR